MTTLEHGELSPGSEIKLRALRLPQILAISVLWFALNFHWSALSLIIVPSQVLKLVGDAHKGEALAFVLVPGAFVALFSNPFFGWLSDQTRGRLALWGRRRPYIVIGILMNVAVLIWMANATTLLALMIAYLLVQFSSNAAQAPFHALLPDIVPAEQRGLVSGIMGLLSTAGNVSGAIVAGLFVNSNLSPAAYQQGVLIAYGVIIAVLLIFMLITVLAVRESTGKSARLAAREESAAAALETPAGKRGRYPVWLTRSLVYTVAGTLLAAVVVWGIMLLWNLNNVAHIQISTDVQQVILELILTLGILRLFDFNPRRNPDFAWVLATRLLMMLGIYTIQDFLLYYMRDVVRVSNAEQMTTNFIIVVSLTSLISAFVAGWLSDRFGRKRMIYVAGAFMSLVGLIFIITHSLIVVLAAGALFGIGYGAYTSVDWALVADTLPSHRHYARDMGVWNISLAVPQVIAPVLGGPLIDAFAHNGQPILGFQLLFAMSILYCLLGTITVRYIKGVKR